jgi:hypothetical protein
VPATVLDCFVGSGTTLIAADRLGRSAIGIDVQPTYIDLAAGRARRDAPLFVPSAPQGAGGGGMSASSLPGVFDDEVAQKLDRWRQEYPDLAVRTPGDCLSLIAAEVKKASRAQGDGVLRRLVNIAAMAKLGYENAQRSDER